MVGTRRSSLAVLLAVLALAPAAGKAPVVKTKMSRAEQMEMYAAAGFPIAENGKPTSLCNKPANPGIIQIDLNGDGRQESIFRDADPCHTPDGVLNAIVTRMPNGHWQGVLQDRTGTLSPAPAKTRTNGWLDLVLTSNGKTIALVFADGRYATLSSVTARANQARAIVPARTAKTAYPTDGWTLPMSVAQLTPGDIAALYTAAGFKRVGGTWKGCDGTTDAYLFDDADLGISPIVDLNGDGRAEVIVGDSGSECYGNTGQAFTILTPAPGGWKNFWSEPGMPEFLPTKSKSGWPDLIAGGPGFCQSIERWNGKAYVFLRQREEMKGACSQR